MQQVFWCTFRTADSYNATGILHGAHNAQLTPLWCNRCDGADLAKLFPLMQLVYCMVHTLHSYTSMMRQASWCTSRTADSSNATVYTVLHGAHNAQPTLLWCDRCPGAHPAQLIPNATDKLVHTLNSWFRITSWAPELRRDPLYTKYVVFILNFVIMGKFWIFWKRIYNLSC
jgi:hypothetical protein